jgi:hypothetical protein
MNRGNALGSVFTAFGRNFDSNLLRNEFLQNCIFLKIQFVSHRKHITSALQTQPVNAVWGNSRCLL